MRKIYMPFIAMLLIFSVLTVFQPANAQTSGLEYKHHVWKINNIDMTTSWTLNQSKVQSDINAFFGELSNIANGLGGSELHIYTGIENTSFSTYGPQDVLFIAPFLKLTNNIVISSKLFSTLESIAAWSDGEELYIDSNTANMLASEIPAKSIIAVYVPSVYFFAPLGTEMPLKSVYSMVNALPVTTQMDAIVNTIMYLLKSRMYATMPGLTNTLPLPLDQDAFAPGIPIAKPDVIRNYGSVWDQLDQPGLTYGYSESNGVADFTLVGSVSDSGISMSVNFTATYNLNSGILQRLLIDVSGSQAVEFDTYAYGYVTGSVQGSFKFDLGYSKGSSFSTWQPDYEPVAYKVTKIQMSEDLLNLINETMGSTIVPGYNVSIVDFISNLRAINTHVENPTGLDAVYESTLQYVDPSSGAIDNVSQQILVEGLFTAGSLRVIPDKDILYGQMLLEGHILTNIYPKFVKYALHVEAMKGYKVPSFDMHGTFGVLESNQGHFALLSNVTFSMNYTDVNPGDIPFIASGSGGIWFTYKKEGYLVESGIQFKINLKYDEDEDGDLSDETMHTFSLVWIMNKVVSEKTKSPGWIIKWDQLDSDPPPFSQSDAWYNALEQAGGAGKISLQTWIAIGAVGALAIVVIIVFLLKRRGEKDF